MKPDVQDLVNEGIFHAQKGKIAFAEKILNKAVELYPEDEIAQLNLGQLYFNNGKTCKAIKCYERVLELKPNNINVLNNLFLLYRLVMDYSKADIISKILDDSGIEEPLISLYKDHNFTKNLEIAKIRSNLINDKPGKYKETIKKKDKLVVGYLSYDFRLHPMAQLIEGLFCNHDKKEFRIIAFSTGYNDKSEWREKIVNSVTKFVDASELNDEELFNLIKSNKIDILVDLGGHTAGSRQRALSFKPAPVIVNFLGFAGSMGSKYHDYIIADRTVIKNKEEKYFTEKVVYMPDTYYPTNNRWMKPRSKYTRKDFSLPLNKFVFASFVQTVKIDEYTFRVWMKILKQNENSILWLLKQKYGIYENYKRLAREAGVNPNRIIYSDELPKFNHISRLKLADLLLDTLVYGAHTTTVDGLWAGIPTITIYGKHFASRTPSSILKAIRLEKLIAKNEIEYVKLAHYYYEKKQELELLKDELKENIKTTNLFNSKKFTENIEKAYRKMYKNLLLRKKNNIYL